MARTIMIDCRTRTDGTFDVWEFASTWSGTQRGTGVSRTQAWKIADATLVGKDQRVSVHGLGRRRKGE